MSCHIFGTHSPNSCLAGKAGKRASSKKGDDDEDDEEASDAKRSKGDTTATWQWNVSIGSDFWQDFNAKDSALLEAAYTTDPQGQLKTRVGPGEC